MKTIIAFVICLGVTIAAAAQWTKQKVDTDASFRGLSVVSRKVIWASGTGGTVIKTVDGGQSWKVIKVPGAEKLDFRDIEAFDDETAYILSIGNGDASRIYRTTDGGKTWELQFQNANKDAFFDALAFWDRDNGIAMSDPVGGSYLLMERVNGAAWKKISIIDEMTVAFTFGGKQEITTDHAPAIDGQAAFAASGTCLIAVGRHSAFLVTGGSAAKVYFSADRGQRWVKADTPMAKGTPGSGIFSIAMRDEKNGIIVGGNYEKPDETAGTLALTSDGGATWTAGTGLTGYRSGVAYIDEKNVIAVGTNGSDISSDGGKTWKDLDKGNYNAVAAKGKAAIWAVGPKGLVSKLTIK